MATGGGNIIFVGQISSTDPTVWSGSDGHALGN